MRELVDHYLEYAGSNHKQELPEFAAWLRDRTQAKAGTELSPQLQDAVKYKGLVLAVAEQWGRLSQFAAVWSKMAFATLPIKTFAEYGLLKYISELNNPTKTDLVEMSMLEKSTCYEIIRRLQQMDLVEEDRDAADKRIRRVRLTPAGQEVVSGGDEQLLKISRVLVGDLDREHQTQLLGILIQLNDFHFRLYQQDHEVVRKDYFE
ncbi:hypothetical protein CRP01_29990 [Flavilitoribacter nigricans DSM 23189 = NBRC 102662]|uniref:HTH marR-type domain-containing protein n=1 Tax=Flavilitoribacter nigricans (strain ATCC 23147 / DSM 23189 / NBRC 102662 / NCIMB 1420 / SS-2) TaxID=1122177 RepID=A0A2D0N2T1_FLAN2|nr:hypothetical protein CRP01_29990 [Flavilitoribacter nigricans DSM 23189 = NBRC 102662]